MSTIRIAILVCDPLLPTICAKYGSYGGVVTAFLTAGMQRLGLPASCLALTIWDVENSFQYPEPDSIDAVIITGSSKYCTTIRMKGMMVILVADSCL